MHGLQAKVRKRDTRCVERIQNCLLYLLHLRSCPCIIPIHFILYPFYALFPYPFYALSPVFLLRTLYLFYALSSVFFLHTLYLFYALSHVYPLRTLSYQQMKRRRISPEHSYECSLQLRYEGLHQSLKLCART